MKILTVYNSKGQLIFTQTNAIEQYSCLVEEVAENKEVIGVDLETNKFILTDRLATNEEKEQLKRELEAKNLELEKKNKELEIKNQNLENKELESLKLTDKVIELTAKNLINQ
ncbi:hypothetical protein FDE76_15345 [Clostridium botulinum]|uniref:Uncharacterized protein n=1 Tax=Clostridium botulinum (strain Eklund 17B / Type B) TaxID=935198 RepID=B2TMU1_CLOBB|nr:hypothetical protein CLL_A1895 [Clostridium botulinum B str. Eklund 17B (NRP)]MBY6977147.1 hypothetical protein [Clostridium botulinum]MBY6999304.1 hypothetical protein [Clostridium botulinum]MCR1272613.1 hypothetical protein [Clostridium botulinum]NFD70011.1 hypothetical protein [Clostridium botulinum]